MTNADHVRDIFVGIKYEYLLCNWNLLKVMDNIMI
ncbi:hypothetical protein SAMN04488055_4741 [Chitinophaga niabensis]|uniref:Uncharacterized protein n=1 Tax=Chitinophaga niabensis TaxID=536979 RepID=A0A1N6JZ31_9BACT|nr:hypothetical protein SAMN04488055_4741 [Chitinophaga niabensis]